MYNKIMATLTMRKIKKPFNPEELLNSLRNANSSNKELQNTETK